MQLFASEADLQQLSIEDADISVMSQLALPHNNAEIFERLRLETDWRQEEVLVWGKRHAQPRLTAWYGDPSRSYSYSGITMNPTEWTDLLLAIRYELEFVTGAEYNSVLLNLYRDNNDSMGFHSDNERSLGEKPVIASLSYGESRTLVFKHKKNSTRSPVSVELTSGSLLLMKGETQRFWKHGINKERDRRGPRINLTFRNIFH